MQYHSLFIDPTQTDTFNLFQKQELPEWDLSHLVPEFKDCDTPEKLADAFNGVLESALESAKEMAAEVEKINCMAGQGFAPNPEAIVNIAQSQQDMMLHLQRCSRYIQLTSQEYFSNQQWQKFASEAQEALQMASPELSKPMMSFRIPANAVRHVVQRAPQLAELASLLTGEAVQQSAGPDPEEMKRQYEEAVAKEPRLKDTRELYNRVHSDQELANDEDAHVQAMAELINAKFYQTAVGSAQAGKQPDEITSLKDGLPASFIGELIPQLGDVVDYKAFDKISEDVRKDRGKPKRPPEFKRKLTWEEAKDLVIDSFTDFHPEYGEVAKLAFEKDWVHAKDNGEKFFNPFTSPPSQSLTMWPGNYPYILTDFEGTLRNLSTLAHEMGHAIAFYLASHEHMDAAESITLHESFAHFAAGLPLERLHEQETSAETKAAIKSEQFNYSLMVMSGMGQNQIEHALHKAVAANPDKPLSVKEIAEITRDEMKKVVPDPTVLDHQDTRTLLAPTAMSSQIIQGPPYYNIAYPVAEATALSMHKQYAEMKPDERREFAEKWLDVMRAGPEMNYGKAMEQMGRTVTTPDKLLADASRQLKDNYAAYAATWPPAKSQQQANDNDQQEPAKESDRFRQLLAQRSKAAQEQRGGIGR